MEGGRWRVDGGWWMVDDGRWKRDLFCIAFQAKLGRCDSHTPGTSSLNPGLRPGLLTLCSWRLPDAPVKQQWSFSTQRRRGFRDSLLGVLRASCGYTPGLLPRTPTLLSPKVTHRPRTTVTDCSLRSGQLSVEGGCPSPAAGFCARTRTKKGVNLNEIDS